MFTVFIYFGVFIFGYNFMLIEKILLAYAVSTHTAFIIIMITGIFLTLIYFIFFASILSWILNIIYILSYAKNGYGFISINLYPIIYIKQNRMKIKASFNILSLFHIYSIIDMNNKFNSERDMRGFIKVTKQVYRRLVYTHYILIILGIVIGIFNIPLGGMIVSYNIIVMIYQSIESSRYFDDGYVALRKKLCNDNIFYIINNFIKVQQFDKRFLYYYLQKSIINNKLDNHIVDDFYTCVITDSINDGFNYLDRESIKLLDHRMNKEAHLNTYSFLTHYKVYLLYCLYIFKFEGKDEYMRIVNIFNIFYAKEKNNEIFKRIKRFQNNQKILNEYNFENINLKDMFDICNLFEYHIFKLDNTKMVGKS